MYRMFSMLAMNIFDLKSYDRFQGYGLGLSTVLKRMVTFSFKDYRPVFVLDKVFESKHCN